MKPYTTIQLNVKVTDTTADQIKRLAAFNQITAAEQLRRFIEEELSINSNAQHIDMIASIIRQELMAICPVRQAGAGNQHWEGRHAEC